MVPTRDHLVKPKAAVRRIGMGQRGMCLLEVGLCLEDPRVDLGEGWLVRDG